MKVTSTMSPPVAREPARPAAVRPSPSASDENGAAVGKANGKAAAAAKHAGHVPPGLERVQARLESIPAESRTAGQARALENIALNIARYRERHGVTDDGAPTTPPDAAAPDTPAPAVPSEATTPAPDETSPVATAPAEPTAEAPSTVPAPTAEAPAADPAPSVEAPATAPETPTNVADAPATVDAPTAAPIDIAALIPPDPVDPTDLLPPAGSVVDVKA